MAWSTEPLEAITFNFSGLSTKAAANSGRPSTASHHKRMLFNSMSHGQEVGICCHFLNRLPNTSQRALKTPP